MDRIRDWKARRAGGRITVTGTDVETGEPIKVPNVDWIAPAGNPAYVVAQDKNGESYGLLVGDLPS